MNNKKLKRPVAIIRNEPLPFIRQPRSNNIPAKQAMTLNDFDVNGLARVVFILINKIRIIGTDNSNIKNFQVKYQQVSDRWNNLMSIILNTTKTMDKKYLQYAYYNAIHNELMLTILNITLSYIIIGPDARSGPGIDNIDRYDYCKYVTQIELSKRMTVEQSINSFIHALTINLDKIFTNSLIINDIHDDHLEHFIAHKKKIIPEIHQLEQTIQAQSNRINSITDVDMTNAIMKDTSRHKELLQHAKDELSMLNTKIDKFKADIDKYQSEIMSIKYRLFKNINFCYFMHDDWYPSLEYELLPAN